MGYKTVIGVGKTNYDTVQLGYPASVSSVNSYNSGTGVLVLNIAGLNGIDPNTHSSNGSFAWLTNLTGTGSFASLEGTIWPVSSSTSTIMTMTVTTGLTFTITGGNLSYSGNSSNFSNNNAQAYTQYGPVGGVICTNAWATRTPGITQAQGTLNNYSAHTASRMGLLTANVQYPSATINNQLVIGGVVGNQNAAFTPSTLGGVQVVDITHTDAVPGSGTSLALAQGWTGAGIQTGYYVFTGVFWEADQPGGASIPFACTIGDVSTPVGGTSSAAWRPPVGSVKNYNTTIGPSQVMMPNAGVWSNIQINVFQNGGSSNTNTGQSKPYQSVISPTYQGGSTTPTFGNQIVTVAGGTYGILSDLSHTDAIPAGSFICTEFYWNLSFNVYFTAEGSTWTPTQQNVTPWICSDGNSVSIAAALAVNAIGYTLPRIGSVSLGSQPVEDSAGMPLAGTFSNHNVTYSAATTGAPQPTFSSGSYPGNALTVGHQTGVVPTSPGNVMDVSHTDAIPQGGIYTGLFANLTGSFTMVSQSALLTTPMPGGGFHFDNLSLLGIG